MRRLVRAAAAALVGASMAAAGACMTDRVANARPDGPRDLYVDGLNGVDDPADPEACGSRSKPCRSPSYAISLAGPNTTVHLAATTVYTDPLYVANTKGALGRPIVIRGDGVAPGQTRIRVENRGNGIMLDGAVDGSRPQPPDADACVAYIAIDNLDIQAIGHAAGPSPSPYNGILVVNAHHIRVSGNTLHDSAGAGVGTVLSDWLTIERNTVYGNSGDTAGRIYTSGISLYWNKDHVGTERNQVDKIDVGFNLVHGNANGPPLPGCMSRGAPCENSDGNGIIIDDGHHSQPVGRPLKSRVPPYRGATRVHDNQVEGNGGAGIIAYQSSNVRIVGNTVRHNLNDVHNGSPKRGEIMASDSENVTIERNLVTPAAGRHAVAIVNEHFFGARNHSDASDTLKLDKRPGR